jgi:hypothetical protein
MLTAVFAASMLSGFMAAPKKQACKNSTSSASIWSSQTARCAW